MPQHGADRSKSFYPPTRSKNRLFFWRKTAIYLLWLGALVSVIVNVCTSGPPWSAYVSLGALAIWVLFLSLETAEISLIRRIISGSLAVSLLLWGIQHFTASGVWATKIAIPLVLLGGLVTSTALYFSAFRRFRTQFLPIFGLSLASFLFLFLGIHDIIPMGWPLIALSGFALASSLAAMILFRKTLRIECKKKLHR